MWFAASRTDHVRRGLRTACALLALTLAGCATTPEQRETTTDWNARRAALLELSEWRVEGRIALNAGKDGWSGTFSWQQAADDLDVRFLGPVGVGGYHLDGNLERLHLKTSSGEELYLTDPERELRQEFGWSIPIRSMRYWMLGVPAPEGEAAETLDADGRLALLEATRFRAVLGCRDGD